jgi:hypothetical protein
VAVAEFPFELALCARLEETTDWVLARQLGGAVAAPGRRVVDVVGVVPGPGFDDRAAVTDRTIPPAAVAGEAGVGTAVPADAAVDAAPGRRERVLDRAVEVGFLDRLRRNGRTLYRRTTRYPDDWFAALVAVENKPDLDRPGDLRRQLRHDAALGLFDRVLLATASHVTRAHLNRIPDPVGVWRVDPATGEREVVRSPEPLPVDRPGVEPTDEHADRVDVRVVDPTAKRRTRRRVAERAYGKGWRTYDLPACARVEPTADGRPRCVALDRVVDPATDCGADCPHRDPADPPAVDAAVLRADRTPWRREPPGVAARQSGLDRFR